MGQMEGQTDRLKDSTSSQFECDSSNDDLEFRKLH